jgi:hypothetical protein
MRRVKPAGWMLLFVAFAILVVSRFSNTDLGELGRPLKVGIVTWPGYVGGIYANQGLKHNKKCIFWRDYKLLVDFVLMDNPEYPYKRELAFASKKPDDLLDIVWSTVDYAAYELPKFHEKGINIHATSALAKTDPAMLV